ncbi:MAG: AtpZ/AtpI family protein [Deferribacterales bacterium]|nr:AtpZ/AtpI family protein [Deferribacterales bacterium]
MNDKKNNDGKDEQGSFRSILNGSTIGLAFVTSIFIGTAIGYFLDDYFGTKPYLLFFFMIMGIISGFRNAIYFLKRAGLWDKK